MSNPTLIESITYDLQFNNKETQVRLAGIMPVIFYDQQASPDLCRIIRCHHFKYNTRTGRMGVGLSVPNEVTWKKRTRTVDLDRIYKSSRSLVLTRREIEESIQRCFEKARNTPIDDDIIKRRQERELSTDTLGVRIIDRYSATFARMNHQVEEIRELHLYWKKRSPADIFSVSVLNKDAPIFKGDRSYLARANFDIVLDYLRSEERQLKGTVHQSVFDEIKRFRSSLRL